MLDLLGFLYAFSIQCIGLYVHGIKMIVFLTSWCGILHAWTFFHLLSSKNSVTTKRLLISSWSLGWAITLMFWFYVFPLSESSKLPPVPLYISSHGGINLFMSIRYLKSNINVETSDLKWPLMIIALYFIGMVIPLKYFGITVYPYFMEKLIPTIVILFGCFFVLTLCFCVGFYIKLGKFRKISQLRLG